MANLNQSLDVITSGQRIIAPADPGPSPLEGLARLGSALMGTSQAYQQAKRTQIIQNRQDTEWAQQQADRAESEGTKKAYDQLAAGYLETMTTPTNPDNIPADIKAGTDDAVRAQRAATKGSVPQTAADLKLEALVNNVAAKYPEKADEILGWVQQRGLDHYIFRQRRNEISMQQLEDQSEQLALKENYQFAIKNGYSPNASFEGGVEFGAKLRGQQAMYEAQDKQIDIQLKQANLTKMQTEQLKTQKSENLYSFVAKDASTRLGYVSQTLNTLVSEAASDPTKLAELGQLPGQINTFIETYRASGLAKIAAGAGTPDDVKNFNNLIDGYKSSITQVYTGPLSQIESNKRSVEIMTTNWKLDQAKALPLYSKFVSWFGKDTVNEMLATNVLNETQIKALVAETQGINVGTPEGMVAQNNVAAIMRGELNIRDTRSPEDRALALRTSKAAISGNQKGAYEGNTESAKQWSNGYSVGLNAAVDINPATATKNDIIGASQMFFTPQARAVIQRMKANPETAGQADNMMVASQGAAVRVLEAAKSPRVSVNANKYQYVKLDDKSGRYYVAFDEAAFNKAYAAGKFNSNQGVSSFEGSIPSIQTPYRPDRLTIRKNMVVVDTDLKRVADSMNAATDHLVQTNALTQEGVTGLNEVQTRKFWATGQLPADKRPKPESGERAPKPADWKTRLDNFSGVLREGQFDIVTNPNTQINGAATVDELWPGLVRQESGGRQSAVSPKGALGVAQVMPETGPEAARLAGVPWSLERLKNDAEYNATLGKAYLNEQLETFDGDPRKALAAYNAGPGRVMKALKRADKEGGDWLEYMPAETRNYVPSILNRMGG